MGCRSRRKRPNLGSICGYWQIEVAHRWIGKMKVVVVEDVDPKIATVPWDGERVAVIPCRVRLVIDRPAGAHVGNGDGLRTV